MQHRFISYNVIQTSEFSCKLAQRLKGGEVICLRGDLGSGKTVFASSIIKYFCGRIRVLSPTFIIVRHYSVENSRINHILHIDLYRLEKYHEIMDLGLNEFMNKPDSIVIIEWAEKMGNLLPPKYIDVMINVMKNNQREVILRYVKQS